jgi:hypothetical protein
VFKVVVIEVSHAVAEADPCPNSTTSLVPSPPLMLTLAASTKPTRGIGESPAKSNKTLFLRFVPDLLAPIA